MGGITRVGRLGCRLPIEVPPKQSGYRNVRSGLLSIQMTEKSSSG